MGERSSRTQPVRWRAIRSASLVAGLASLIAAILSAFAGSALIYWFSSVMNQFGANIGGPVFIPKLYQGTDKTFFFFNWESGRLAQGAVSSLTLVPPTATRTGDFRGLTNARTGAPITLRDPATAALAGRMGRVVDSSPERLAPLRHSRPALLSAGHRPGLRSRRA